MQQRWDNSDTFDSTETHRVKYMPSDQTRPYINPISIPESELHIFVFGIIPIPESEGHIFVLGLSSRLTVN